MLYAADFETTTSIDEETGDVRVWAFGLCEIGNTSNFIYGETMEEFLSFCSKSEENHILYYQNLKFDGSYIINYLFRHDFKWVDEAKNATSNSFTTLITNVGTKFYSIEIYFKKQGKHVNKVTIYDSLKMIPMSVDDIAKKFKLPISKLSIDYDKERPKGYKLTREEIEYLKNDVTIMSMALDPLFKEGHTKMTIGSNALADYKKIVTSKTFSRLFPSPSLEMDAQIRQSYKGGFVYVNPMFQNKTMGDGIVLDVNSLYPSVMYYTKLPYGEGKYFIGEYKPDKIYDLYIQIIRCQFELKPKHLPTIQIKNMPSNFLSTEYLTSSINDAGIDEEVVLCLTSVDLELFLEHYNVYNLEFLSGWKFKSTNTMFTSYIDKWMNIKIQSKIDGNYGMYQIAKLFLNSLYGKFGTNPKVGSRIPILDNKGILKFLKGEETYREPIYIPLASFVTARARHKTITSAQKVFHRFMYGDTDSLHLYGTEIPKELEISDTDLGKWKHEFTFDKAKYIRTKCYMERGFEPNKPNDIFTKITVAGMPSRCYEYVNFDNFNIDAVYPGKLTPKQVPGGVILEKTEFTIRG